MNQLDLSRGLRELSAAPRIDAPIDEAGVARRVRRGRAVRTSGLVAACVAGALGLGTAVWAIGPFDTGPLPPARTTEPAPVDPTPTDPAPTDPEPDDAPDRDTTSEPDATSSDLPPLVAVDTDGALVLLDPSTGAVTRTVAEGLGELRGDTLDVDPGAGTVTLTVEDTGDAARDIRVSLEDGSVETLAGRDHPLALSADGRWSVARTYDAEAADRGETIWGYTLRDRVTGDERWVADPGACECDQFASAAWAPDASAVAVLTGYADGRVAVRDLAVLPVGAGTWDDALLVQPEPLAAGVEGWRFWTAVAYLGPDELAVLEYEDRLAWSFETESGFPDEVPATAQVVVLDPRTGAELRRTPVRGLDAIGWRMSPAPDGDGLLVTTHEWSGATPLTHLHRVRSDGTAETVATGYRAIGW